MAWFGTIFTLARDLFLINEFDCWTPDVFFRFFGNSEKNATTGKDPERWLEINRLGVVPPEIQVGRNVPHTPCEHGITL